MKIIYTVKYGDSFGVIAMRFGVTINDLARWNNIAYLNFIYPGQRLIIKKDSSGSPDLLLQALVEMEKYIKLLIPECKKWDGETII